MRLEGAKYAPEGNDMQVTMVINGQSVTGEATDLAVLLGLTAPAKGAAAPVVKAPRRTLTDRKFAGEVAWGTTKATQREVDGVTGHVARKVAAATAAKAAALGITVEQYRAARAS